MFNNQILSLLFAEKITYVWISSLLGCDPKHLSQKPVESIEFGLGPLFGIAALIIRLIYIYIVKIHEV